MNEAVPPEELRRQYDRALSEYRFQVDLNWRRSEYFFVLNVGVLIAAATMFSSNNVPDALVAVLFLIGALLALLSILANEAQHSYYRSAREKKRELEDELDLNDLALATTPGMGGTFRRLGRVRTFLKIMLVAIAAVDVGGAAFAVADAAGSSAGDEEPSVLLDVSSPTENAWRAIVVSQDGSPVRSLQLKPRSLPILVRLQPGRYLVSVGGGSFCQRAIVVSTVPLQPLLLRC